MKKNILKIIILLTILIGFGSYIFLHSYSVEAEDLSDSRDISREGNVNRDAELNINRDTEVIRGSGIERDPEDEKSPHDRDSVLCDPKYGGDPNLCITPTPNGGGPTPTIHCGTPTPPTGGGDITPTPTPGPQGGPPEDTTDHNSPGTPPGPSGGNGIGQVLGLSFTSGNENEKFFFMLSGIVCSMSGLVLIKTSKRI